MALSKCPHCDGKIFELQEVSPIGAAYKSTFVQCSGCGAPVGAMDYFNVGTLLKNQEAKIDELSRKVDQIDYSLQLIAQALQR